MEILYGLGFLVLFGCSALCGMALRRRLHEDHLSHENMDAVRLVTGLLVTFAALMLSLQLTTARSTFDKADRDRSLYAGRLARLDECLSNLGAETDPIRRQLRQYTAAVIASTWPGEKAPSVDGMPDSRQMARNGEDATLKALMNRIGMSIDVVVPVDAARANMAARCRANMAARCRANYTMVQQARWAVIEDGGRAQLGTFSGIVGFWLMLVFLSLGLQVPRRLLSAIVLAIGVIAVASVMFVIFDLDTPYSGAFGISSHSMRAALADMSR